MAWAFVGVSTAVTVTATAHTLTLPANLRAGDLLVAVISSRIASTTSITLPAGWTRVAESKTNNVVAAATTSEASGMMAYIMCGDDPSVIPLTFTHPTAPSVAMGQIVAYRGGNVWSPFDVGVGAKTSTAITAISTTGLTTGQANELIVKGVCSGRAAALSAHDAATDPTTSSGAGAVQTAAPIVGTWQERQDASTTTGADTALAIADAIRGTAGATGNLTCTSSVSGGHVQVAGAFRIEPIATPGSSSISQTGSQSDFTASSANSGTVSSTITVPSDAQIVVVGVQGWCATANYFTSMTFTKGGADTAMTRVGTTEPGNGQTAAIFYLVLPDTGTNKSLKFDWAGTGAPGETPIISVTFWKGIDTASPVRSSGASLPAVASIAFPTRTSVLTAQNGDLVVAFVGGDTAGAAQEGSVNTWYNLNLVSQCTNGGAIRHDGAWGSFAPSADLYVGADTATNFTYGVCSAIVLMPTGSSVVQTGATLEFGPGVTNTGTVSTTITVPSDAQLILVGHSGYSSTANYYSTGSMTFTKGGVDTAMTSVGSVGSDAGSSHAGQLFYMALPDTGANKTLKWDWLGSTNEQNSQPITTVTFWKGVDTASPIRDAKGGAGGSLPYTSASLAAQAGDRIVAFVGASHSAEGSAATWSAGLGTLSQLTRTASGSDGAWGAGTATGATTVALSTGSFDGGGSICVVAIKPALTFIGFGRNSSATSTTSVTVPATASGDVIIVAGLGNTIVPTVQTAGGQSAVFAKIGDITSPRNNPGKEPNFVGIITNPAVGTTTVTLNAVNAGETELACWVVRGFTNPVQDIGQWGAYQITAIGQSGLSPTLAVADEFAIGFNYDPTTSIKTDEPGSSGFTQDGIGTYGAYSHKIITDNAPIQAAFNSGGSGGCTSLVTYRSTPPAAPAAHPYTLVEYQCTGGLTTSLTVNIAATQAGDVIFVAGEANSTSTAGISVQTNNGNAITFGTLGGVTSPRAGAVNSMFVGMITPTVGSTSVTYLTTASNYKAFGVWVVRGMTSPSQDKGVWIPDQTDGICESGLTGTLADANEFAFASCSLPHTWELRTDQTGSSGFKLDSFCPTSDGGYAHQLTTTTGSIQSAWETTPGNPGDVVTATYRANTGPISQTGGIYVFAISDAASASNTGTVSTTITVPTDAELIVVGWSGQPPASPDGYFSGGVMKFTKGGVDTNMVSTPGLSSDVGGLQSAPLFYMALPDTGTNKTLKWDWSGSAAPPGTGAVCSITFWKGVDTASPVRDIDGGGDNATPFTIPSVTTQADDLVLGWAGFYDNDAEQNVTAWNNLNTLANLPCSGINDAAWGIRRATGTSLVTGITSASYFNGALTTVVLRPAGTGVTGTLDVTDSPDTAFTTFTGTVENRGVLDVTDTADTAAFTGTVAWLAVLDATDTADTAAFTGTVEWQGIFFATDDPDTAAFTGTVENRGILDVTDSPDTADFVGVVLIEVTGILDARDDPDTAAFTGDLTAYTEGILDATDLPDIAAFAGTVFTDVTGVLTATDIPDIAAFTGEIISSGVLDATDAPDIAAFTGNIFDVVTGILDATEDADTASFISDVTNFGILNVTDSPDIAAFTGEVITSGVLNATDTPDTADFTGTITAIVPFSQVCIIG